MGNPRRGLYRLEGAITTSTSGDRVMRKWLLAGAGVAAAGLAAALVLTPSLLRARPAGQPDEPGARAAQLPIGQVVLFSSGVGYFQREGSVEGDARVDL